MSRPKSPKKTCKKPRILPAILRFETETRLRLGGHLWLAMTCAQLGRMDEAQAEAAELLRVDPNYSIPGRSRRILGFKSAKHYFDGLRKSGLPE